MKEVEILIRVYDKKEDVLKILKKFKFKGSEKVSDIYFHDPVKRNLSTDSSGRLKECFRLRQKGGKSYIAYKIDHFDKDNWIYSDEYETKTSSLGDTKKIIENLGLKTMVKIESEKSLFQDRIYKIILEEVKDLGLFLEVEKLVKQDKETISTKKQIRDFIISLKIKSYEELNLGKPELMLRKLKNEL